MTGKGYAVKIDSIEDDLENIESFIYDSDVVMLVEHIEDAQDFFDDEIIIVEPED